jgi:hypothetical protein
MVAGPLTALLLHELRGDIALLADDDEGIEDEGRAGLPRLDGPELGDHGLHGRHGGAEHRKRVPPL